MIVSQQMPTITEISFEIGYIKLYSDLPGANELKHGTEHRPLIPHWYHRLRLPLSLERGFLMAQVKQTYSAQSKGSDTFLIFHNKH